MRLQVSLHRFCFSYCVSLSGFLTIRYLFPLVKEIRRPIFVIWICSLSVLKSGSFRSSWTVFSVTGDDCTVRDELFIKWSSELRAEMIMIEMSEVQEEQLFYACLRELTPLGWLKWFTWCPTDIRSHASIIFRYSFFVIDYHAKTSLYLIQCATSYIFNW